ncbi:MAG: LON peptidase substrate-binding domain-containing protein [Verrucomicrobia bacterium]|nr:LON peptidase substrate-binding domain-containing protein [Verrucomicrobiota bacterium]
MEITLPNEIAVMTLPDMTFFPQALLPLHIFEPRYQQMLKESLATDRLFAVAGINSKKAKETGQFEPPHRIATVGIVRACQKSDNGTSNLLLQGLARVEIVEILSEQPFRRVRIKALSSSPGADTEVNTRLRQTLGKLLHTKQRLGGSVPGEFSQFLKTVNDPETFVDLAAATLCDDTKLKQKLLETLDVHARLQLYTERVRHEIETLKLQQKLQGRLPDNRIERN